MLQTVFLDKHKCLHAGPPRQDPEGDLGRAGQGRDRRQGEHGGGPPEVHLPQHVPRLRGSLVLAKAQVCEM